MKFLPLLWITIRSALDAAAWATALWCLIYSFSSILWLQFFGVCLVIHLIGNLSLAKYLSSQSSQDCFLYMRGESALIGLSVLCAPIIAVLPTIVAILFLSYLQAWTNLETHWLHTLLFVTCTVYLLLRAREKRRTALRRASNSPRSMRVIDI